MELDIAYVLSKRDCRLNTHQELFHSNTVASSKHEVDTGFIQLLFPLVIMRVHDDIIVTLSIFFSKWLNSLIVLMNGTSAVNRSCAVDFYCAQKTSTHILLLHTHTLSLTHTHTHTCARAHTLKQTERKKSALARTA